MLSAPGYQELLPRIRSYVPQSSVVGMLLEHEEPYTVVKSRHLGIFQHDPYTWAVRGGGFLCLEELSDGSRNLDLTLKSWLAGLTPQDRELFLDSLYQALEGTQAQELEDLAHPKRLYALIQGLVQLDEDTRNHILHTLKKLLRPPPASSGRTGAAQTFENAAKIRLRHRTSNKMAWRSTRDLHPHTRNHLYEMDLSGAKKKQV